MTNPRRPDAAERRTTVRRLALTLAFLLAMFVTNATATYADDGGGMVKPPSTDRELTVR